MTRFLQILVCAAALWTFIGCYETVRVETMYTVRPYIQATSTDGLDVMDYNAYGWGFYADTAVYAVASYDDALEGIITSKVDGSKKSYDLIGDKVDQGQLEFLLTSMPVMLVVVDPVEKLYAWRHAQIAANLPIMNVPVFFRPWKESSLYIDTRWNMVNEFYVEEEAAE